MAWDLQRSRRNGGDYWSAVYRVGSKRVESFGLGRLDDNELSLARSRRSSVPDLAALVRFEGVSSARQRKEARRRAVRCWLLDPDVSILAAEAYPDPPRTPVDLVVDPEAIAEMTLRQCYEEVWYPHRLAARPETARREHRRWSPAGAGGILDFLGHVQMKNLRPLHWDRFNEHKMLAKKNGQPGGWGPTARRLAQNEYIMLLRYVADNCDSVPLRLPKRIKQPRKPQRPRTPHRPEEIPRILDAAGTDMHRCLFAVAIMATTRPSEVTKLDWQDVQWEGHGKIRFFHWASDADGKNAKAEDWVPMTPQLRTELHRYWMLCGNPASGPVFLWRGKKIKSWSKAFRGACRRAGVQGDQFPAICRHTGAANMKVNGVPPVAAKLVMRHREGSTIYEDVYGKVGVEWGGQILAEYMGEEES